jgi:hypothetical protein
MWMHSRRSLCRFSRMAIAAAGLSAFLGGCRPSDGIVSYEILKHAELQKERGGTTAEPVAPEPAKPARMLGAILPHGEQLWFFKLTGDPEPVAGVEPAFREFLKSITFPKPDTPTWTLPEGWRASDQSHPMRFATVLIGSGSPPLELTVSMLARGSGELPQMLLANVNRWRGQLGLPSVADGELAGESEELETSAGTVVLVNLLGESSAGGGMGAAPFAAGMKRGALPPAAAASAGPAIKYETPEGWQPGRVGGLRKAAFTVTDDELGKVEATVIDLPREAGGDRLANVNRWRMQVGLKEIDEKELKEQLQSLEIGNLKGDYCILVGEPSGGRTQTILGVLLDRDDLTWFIKLQGDAKLAEREREHFEAFAKSLRFE